jgi:hypothetical protein
MAGPGDASWDDWQANTDLMRRVVAKFLLRLQDGETLGRPAARVLVLDPLFQLGRVREKAALRPFSQPLSGTPRSSSNIADLFGSALSYSFFKTSSRTRAATALALPN